MSKKKELKGLEKDLENDFLDDYIKKNFPRAIETLKPHSWLLLREEIRGTYGFQAYAVSRAISLLKATVYIENKKTWKRIKSFFTFWRK